MKQAEFLAHCETLNAHRLFRSALFPGWLHRIWQDRCSNETLYVIQPNAVLSGRKDLSFMLLESIIAVAIHNEQNSAGHNTRYSHDDNRYCSDMDIEDETISVIPT